MYNTNSHNYTTYKLQQKKQHQHVKQTIATTDGHPTVEQASSQNIPQKMMGLLNSFGMDTTFVSVYISYVVNKSKTIYNTNWISWDNNITLSTELCLTSIVLYYTV